MYLENIPKRKNRKKKGKRLGRGYGSGVGGHTANRGMKGQKSRAGHKSLIMFEGGNVPFFKRIPKYRGFNKPDKKIYTAVNIDVINDNFKSGETVNLENLKKKGLIAKKTQYVKILGVGEIKKEITISELPVSKSAREKIEKAGGTIK